MGECPKCGRKKPPCSHCADKHPGHCYAGLRYGGNIECDEVATAYERGLREGFAIAEERAWIFPACPPEAECGCPSGIAWTDARAELERRLSGKERGE